MNIEHKKGYRPGQLLIVSLRTLEKESGIARQTIATILQDLFFDGLVEFKKGEQHKFNKTASEIRRIIPIPG